MSDLYKYWSGLSEVEKGKFAGKSELSVNYINTHLIHKRKTPPLNKLKQMAYASNGALTYHGLCDFFVEEDLLEEA